MSGLSDRCNYALVISSFVKFDFYFGNISPKAHLSGMFVCVCVCVRERVRVCQGVSHGTGLLFH